MVPDTTNQSLIFLEWQPDWSKPVDVNLRHETSITTTLNGVEQRARRREHARYAISFVRSALEPLSFSQDRAAARMQLSAPIVFPMWTDPWTLAQMTTPNRAALTQPLAGSKFKPGHYAYFAQTGLQPIFRKVLALGPDYLDLDPSVVSPPGGLSQTFTAGATIYPAIVGFRAENSAQFVSHRVDHQSHPVTIEEL